MPFFYHLNFQEEKLASLLVEVENFLGEKNHGLKSVFTALKITILAVHCEERECLGISFFKKVRT